jgi:hypothetical protein
MTFNPQPKQGMPLKKAKKPIKRTRIKYKPKNTLQVDTFEEIAEERPWVCFVTGEPLKELTATQFMHVLPKALNKYPKFKNHKPNIVLATNDVHFKWDHTPRSELRKDPRFDKLFYLEIQLKEEYKQLYGK